MKSSTHTFLITEPHCEVTYDCTREKSTLLAPGLTLFPLSPSKAILPFLFLYTHRDESLHVLSTFESCFSLVLYLCVIYLATYLLHHLVTQAGLALKIFLHRLPSGKTELCAILPKRRKNPQPEIRLRTSKSIQRGPKTITLSVSDEAHSNAPPLISTAYS